MSLKFHSMWRVNSCALYASEANFEPSSSYIFRSCRRKLQDSNQNLFCLVWTRIMTPKRTFYMTITKGKCPWDEASTIDFHNHLKKMSLVSPQIYLAPATGWRRASITNKSMKTEYNRESFTKRGAECIYRSVLILRDKERNLMDIWVFGWLAQEPECRRAALKAGLIKYVDNHLNQACSRFRLVD